jgi:4-hydroxy-tetrahydrodipicolinate synthase
MLLEGVYTALITPFTTSGDLDVVALATLVRHVVDGGGEGIVPLGTTGEGYALNLDERAEVLRVVHEVCDGAVGLIAGVTASTTQDAIANAQLAAEVGYQGVMVAPPPYVLPSPAELAAHFAGIASDAGVPVVLYDYPLRAGVPIGWEVLDELHDHSGVVAIKEASGDLGRVIEMRTRYGDRYEIVCGADPLILDFALWGSRAWIAGGSGVLPREHSDILARAVAGDFEGAKRALDQLLPMLLAMEQGGYIQTVRAGLTAIGLPAGTARPPLQRPDDVAAATFLETLQALV